MSESQSQAKRFFANRVIQQATADGTPLSDAERQMLSWSESDPDFKADPQLTAAFADHTSDEEFERKISGLLELAFQADVDEDPQARERWRKAYAVLQRGDHYMTVMIERALGSRMTTTGWRQIWGVRAIPTALAVFVLLLVGMFVYEYALGALLGHTPSGEELGQVTWTIAVVVALALGAARLVLGADAFDGFLGRVIDRVRGNRRQ